MEGSVQAHEPGKWLGQNFIKSVDDVIDFKKIIKSISAYPAGQLVLKTTNIKVKEADNTTKLDEEKINYALRSEVSNMREMLSEIRMQEAVGHAYF
ncbi:11837_t:CDS:2 [Dentiscutata erythropus]|uniref:11837_t:CDS:1 n=1 Tax=Dentiscutata erythropus TaxID=1348616 RepID=A0A9N9EHI9_9GLOM|nr:11837_t:CDS:2 [Dentiscutata erythropus]